MKQTLLAFFTLSIAYLSLTSSSSGPTNSGLSTVTSGCDGSTCHGYIVDTAVKVELQLAVKSTGQPVTTGHYIPNEMYTATITGTYTPATVFGFYVASYQYYTVQSGTFSNLPAGTKLSTLGNGMKVVEHTNPLAAVGGKFSLTFDWTAPAQGLNMTEFQVVVCGANGDGIADIQDRYFTQWFRYFELPVGINELVNDVSIHAYPNPATSVLNIDINGSTADNYQYVIYDINGVVSADGQLNSHKSQVDVSALSGGRHFIHVKGGTVQKVISFSKL